MKRFVLSAVGLVVAAFVVIVVFFSASRYRVDDQSFVTSFSDFLFLISPREPPSLTDRSYERVMAHARRSAHREARGAVVRTLVRWGDEVVPRLMRELERWGEPGRVLAAAEALGELRVVSSLPLLETSLARARGDRRLRNDLIEATARLGPEAAPVLIAVHREARRSGEPLPYDLLDALGQTGGGTEFLLAELAAARTPDEILELEWPLAYTRDERAGRALVALLHHPTLHVRRRARDAMSQSMGPAAIEPALDLFVVETDDYVRSWILESILASRNAAGSPRAVRVLGSLLDDRLLGNSAGYALTQIASPEALEVLQQRSQHRDPASVIEYLDYAGIGSLGILEAYLRHEDAGVRRRSVSKLEELRHPDTVPVLEDAMADPDRYVRQEATLARFRADHVLLAESFRQWLQRRTGESWGRPRLPRRPGARAVLSGLGFLNWVGLVASVVLGGLMLAGRLRSFEPYRFTLSIVFFLTAGITLDYFLAPDPQFYRLATGARLVLLLGLLFLRDDPLPGENRARLDRLVVRSLWALVPLLLVFGVPFLADMLRRGLSDFDFLQSMLLLLGVCTILAVEQWLVPWEMFPRGGLLERVAAFGLSCAVAVLVGVGILRYADNEALTTLFLVALAGAIAFQFRQAGFWGLLQSRSRSMEPAPGRLSARYDGEVLSIRLPRKRNVSGWPHFLFGAGFLVVTWWLSARLSVSGAAGPGLLLLMVFALLGTAMVSLVATGLAPVMTVQIHRDAIRAAPTFFGGAFGAPVWHRRLRAPILVGRLRVTPAERQWLEAALGAGRDGAEPRVSIVLRARKDGVEMRVLNLGTGVVRLEDIETTQQAAWTAEVDGERGDVYFSRSDREVEIPPGKARIFRPRVHPWREASAVIVRCGTMGPWATT